MNQLIFLRSITGLVILVSFLILSACQSTSTTSRQNLGPQDALLIDSKAQIKNSRDSNTVQIEIVLLPQRAIRMEITGTLGVSVASVLLTPQSISYVIYPDKQYASGPFHAKTLYPIFKKNIDPLLVWRILHGQSPASELMTCENNVEQKPLLCSDGQGNRVKWIYEGARARRIDLTGDHFEMNWVFKSEKIFNSYHNETFVLKKPTGYTEIIIK